VPGTVLTLGFFACDDFPSIAGRKEYIAQGDNMPVRFTLSPPNAPRAIARTAAAILTVALITACATDKTEPTGLNASVGASSSNGVPFAAGLASPAWQLKARDLVSAASLAAVQATHIYPILGVAQYLAVQEAQAAIIAGGRERLEADRGAVAGASAVTMTYLFPASAATFEAMVTAQANAGPGQPHPSFAAGEAIGRAVGAQIVDRATHDHFNDPNTAVPPPGGTAAGYWTPNAPGQMVAGGTLPGTTPWFLTSSDQFRPDPHPPFGSTAFNDALAEIRHISDTRTAEQIHIATIWALSNGTPTTSGFWLAVPTDSGWVAQHNLSERETTHLYALVSSTMFDAQIGCWDEKLRSWLVRPWKADPAITTFAPVGMPNHPSYPSGHSCLSASAASVLSRFFPEHTAQLDAMVAQAGLSRMYGGIHYRFDISAGQTLGRNVARFTIAQDASGNSVLTPH
jgi:membrane-associated phospholipid phosphatase